MDADSCSHILVDLTQMVVLEEICLFTHRIGDTVSERSIGRIHAD